MKINKGVCLLEQPHLRDLDFLEQILAQEGFLAVSQKGHFRGVPFYYLFCEKCAHSHMFPPPKRFRLVETDTPDHVILSKMPIYLVRISLVERFNSKIILFEKFETGLGNAFYASLLQKIESLSWSQPVEPLTLESVFPQEKTRAVKWFSDQVETSIPQDFYDVFMTEDGKTYFFEVQVQREDQITFKNRTTARYGLCRTNLPREFWYITIAEETFIVDKAYLKPEFITEVDSILSEWLKISRERLFGFNPFDGVSLSAE